MSTVSPILFMVFNRPGPTQRVFEAIRAARPTRLYVAADGPRSDRPNETDACEQTRRIATAVDWPCEVSTLFRDSNLGCRRAVSSAIDWFFDHEPEGIVLEDDCLPDPSFFAYCDALLAHHRDDERITCISGDNFVSSAWQPESSYYYSSYVHIWGWASWRRAWRHYDVGMRDWSPAQARDVLSRTFPGQPAAQRHWQRVLDRVAAGQVDTWDYQWVYACWKQGGLSCLPRVNLISNIGFGADATHTVSAESKLAALPVGSLPLPLTHPSVVEAELQADRWTTRHVLGIEDNLLGRLRRGGALLDRATSALRAMAR